MLGREPRPRFTQFRSSLRMILIVWMGWLRVVDFLGMGPIGARCENCVPKQYFGVYMLLNMTLWGEDGGIRRMSRAVSRAAGALG